MMTLIVLLVAVAVVVAAGEGVRLQCRRMLDRPVRLVAPAGVTAEVPTEPQRATAVAA